MKKNFTLKSFVGILAACSLVLVACYDFVTVEMPSKVNPNDEFTIASTIKWDGDDKVESYGNYGICVPEGWEVSFPAEAIVYYSETGAKVASEGFTPHEIYTEMLNHRYAREGYVWYGFITQKATRGTATSDHVVINVLVQTDDTQGEFVIDQIVGDETENYEKYRDQIGYDWTWENDNRLMHTATFDAGDKPEDKDHGSVERVHTECSRTVTVGDAAVDAVKINDLKIYAPGAGKLTVKAENNSIVSVYDVNGNLIACNAVINGVANIDARPGVAVVSVVKGAKKTVKKVIVR